MTASAMMFYGPAGATEPEAGPLVKEAAPAWIRMLRAGKLSPENLAKITANMTPGGARFVKYLGRGLHNQADLMAGNIGGTNGLLVRKLPTRALPTQSARSEAARNLVGSRILERNFPGISARYLRGSNERGLFQEFGNKSVVPNWVTSFNELSPNIFGKAPHWGLSRGSLSPVENTAIASAQRVYKPLADFGVKDITPANLGPRGQLIDYQLPINRNVQAGGSPEFFEHPFIVRLPEFKNNTNITPADAIRKFWLNKQSALAPGIELQEHQQRIADRITGEDPRLLVYHGLGSGKSLSAIAAAEAAKKEEGGEYGVVVPASLKGNFEKEIGKFTRNSNPEIMSYTGLGMGKDFATNPDTLIMDEAARLRNPTAASTSAAIRAARRAKRLVLLTGTPITNEPSDIASLLSMLNNQTITPQQFDQQFVSEKKVRPGILAWLRGVKPGMKPVIKNEDKLRELLKGKVDYLPSKTPEGVNVNEQVVKVPLSPAQQKIQKAIRTKIPPGFLWKLDKEFPLSRDELAKLNSFLTGLRQVSLSTQPFRADQDVYRAYTQSSKLQKAMADLQETLKSDPRKKAIIYSNFIDAGLRPYAAALEKNKIPHGFFHGSIPLRARQKALKEYNEGKLRALLLGPAAAEGISTKGTSLIQLLDPHWNEARSQQAKGRGLRFDSHADLPEELRNVAVRRYLSASEEPGLIGKYILGKKRERTGDEVLERLTSEKEQFNNVFRDLLREVGQEKQNAQAQRGDVFPVSCHEHDAEVEPGQVSCVVPALDYLKKTAAESAPMAKKKKPVPEFKPDFTPEQLEEMGVYDALYRGIGPRLASLGEWKPEWVNPVDPKGWAQWYKRYSGGRRLGEEDERQIKRWANFKSRHGGPFVKKPTPRRGWALQNWAIDPSLLVPETESDKIRTMLRDYAVKQTAKHVANSSAEK